jgi:hypothetical protein
MVVKGHGSVTETSKKIFMLVPPGLFMITLEYAYISRVTVCPIRARSVASTMIMRADEFL